MNYELISIPSPNFTGGRPGPILGSTLHSTVSTWASAIAELTRPDADPVSAHFVIDLNRRRVAALVDIDNQAWHARSCNAQWIGFEFVDNGDHADPIRTPEQYETGAELIHGIHADLGLPVNDATVRPHRSCVATACPSGLDVGRIIAGGGILTDQEWQAFLAEYGWTTKAIKTVLAQLANADHPLKIADGKLAVDKHVLNPEIRAALRQLERSDARVAKLMRAARPRRAAKPPTDAQVRAGHGRG